jgi:hypothetical protein
MKLKNYPHYVVLHGGLGNQLFQYFHTCVLAAQSENAEIRLITDFLARYSSPRNIELLPLIELRLSDRLGLSNTGSLLRMRIPKVLKRVTGRELVVSIPGYGVIVDGYFQEIQHYKNCPAEVLAEELAVCRRTLTKRLSLDTPGKGRITHIRLGDFFDDRGAARSFASRQLLAITGPTDLVTDQEDVMADELAKLDLAHPVRLLPSADMPAWDLMALMCRYEVISTNGSTLAFWAAVIRGAELHSANQEHVAIWRLLGQATEKEQPRR